MHLSFSLTGLDSGSDVPIGGQVIHLFLQSVGVTLTEVQDVVFRLAIKLYFIILNVGERVTECLDIYARINICMYT